MNRLNEIRDFELIQNVDILFEKPAIIIGAGHLGTKICALLQGALIKIEYIYDKKLMEDSYMGIPTISFEGIKKVTDCKDYILIIGTETHREEMLTRLEEHNIRGYICTWHGVQTAIELNIENEKFLEEFRIEFIQRKKVATKFFSLSDYFANVRKIYEYPQAVWVWQPKKVGSKTVVKTLENSGINTVHLHSVMKKTELQEKVSNVADEHINYLKTYYSKGDHTLKIITLVREPIARALSGYMNAFSQLALLRDVDKDLVKGAEAHIIESLENDYEFQWFNEEIRELTNIDIYRYPFDKELGYAWIKENKIEILILKTETLNQNARIIGEFVGCPNIEISNENVGAEKHYVYLYDEIKKRIKLPRKVLKEQYESSEFTHFYSEKEIQAFWQKWEGRLTD
ncbi:MAG: hypothetical protein IJE49_01710 [Agathobacter sp.]|nr:hypothetical protein [Agathobacter sp.]